MTEPLALYVHWPYCAKICPYCDFNVVRAPGRDGEAAALARAIVEDLRGHAARLGPRRLTSIFFGGGTPSLMAPSQVARVIDEATRLWTPADDLEISLEANPTDAEAGAFADLAAAGVERLSLGLQSLDDAALKLLGRNHGAAEGLHAAAEAREHFRRLSLDMIYALPGQTPEAWRAQLDAAVALGPEHLSPYQLTIEAGTAFDRAVRRGVLRPPGEDTAADLYETTQAVLEEHGFEAYEVSNHARSLEARSRHNLAYWRGWDYAGVGPGAHGRLTIAEGRIETLGDRGVQGYIERVARTGVGWAQIGALSPRDIALERLLMGLRTVEGVALDDLAPLSLPASRLETLAGQGLVRVSQRRLFATLAGRPLLDGITRELSGA